MLYIEIDTAFQGQLQDLTLICGGDPMVDPGPFGVDNLPPLCETDGMTLASTVIGGVTPASVLSPVYYATDRDNDQHKDTEDNCEIVANADQHDSDGDRIGNIAERVVFMVTGETPELG